MFWFAIECSPVHISLKRKRTAANIVRTTYHTKHAREPCNNWSESCPETRLLAEVNI